MLKLLEELDSLTIASVEVLKAVKTLFKLFWIIKNTVGLDFTISEIAVVEIR